MSLRRFSEICRPPRKLSVNSADKTSCYFTRLKKFPQKRDAFFNACQYISPAFLPAPAAAAHDRRRPGLAGVRGLAVLPPAAGGQPAPRRLRPPAAARDRRCGQGPDGAAL